MRSSVFIFYSLFLGTLISGCGDVHHVAVSSKPFCQISESTPVSLTVVDSVSGKRICDAEVSVQIRDLTNDYVEILEPSSNCDQTENCCTYEGYVSGADSVEVVVTKSGYATTTFTQNMTASASCSSSATPIAKDVRLNPN